jgi:hypothetical protein
MYLPRRKLLTGLGIGVAGLLAQSASADTLFVNFPFRSTGSVTARTMPDRLAEVKNVKDFGAVGNGVADDTLKYKPLWIGQRGPIEE